MKKLTSILLTLALMLTAAMAFAATPSKTTADTSRVVSVEPATDGFAVFVDEDAEEVLTEIAQLYEAVNVNKLAPIEYFPEDVQTDVAALLPEGFDLTTLELNEFLTVSESGYVDTMGDVKALFEFATPYAVGQKLVALMGFYNGEKDTENKFEAEWVVLQAEVQEDGLVAVYIPAEMMTKMASSKAVALAMLSEPIQK